MELLVSVALAVLVLSGLAQIYAASKKSFEIQTTLSRVQDTARYAFDIISDDLRRAGYWGMLDMQTAIANGNLSGDVPPNGSCPSSNNSWGLMVRRRLFGLNESSTGYRCITEHRAGTDVLVVRYASAETHNPNFDIVGRSYLFAAALEAQVGTAPLPFPRPLSDTITGYHHLRAHAYYVTKAHGTGGQPRSCEGVQIPALAREHLSSIGFPQREELVTGVEQLQVLYGVDSDGDGIANQYQNADGVADWNQVAAVRFWLLVRDECPESGYTDPVTTYVMGDKNYTPSQTAFRRYLYSGTVALRN